METSPSLAKRVEEACLNGWPGFRSVLFDGWLLRFSKGHSRRANSVSLLGPSTIDIETKIRACEDLYAMHGLPAIFRISDLSAENIGPELDRRGYGEPEDPTCVLYRDFTTTGHAEVADTVTVQPSPTQAWLDTVARIQLLNEAELSGRRAIYDAVAVPCGYAASLAPDGRIASIAFGAVHGGIMCVSSVATDPVFRRQGHARKVTEALVSWAWKGLGADGACLAVHDDNTAARVLYRSLGFGAEISRYAYRRAIDG